MEIFMRNVYNSVLKWNFCGDNWNLFFITVLWGIVLRKLKSINNLYLETSNN
jgi:hypothetical protein